MSVMIVSLHHIRLVVTRLMQPDLAFLQHRSPANGGAPHKPDELGALLWRANYDNFNHRYKDGGVDVAEFVSYKHKRVDLPSEIECYKALQCLDYNCEDVPGYETTRVGLLLSAAISAIAHRIISGDEGTKDRYNAAAWSV